MSHITSTPHTETAFPYVNLHYIGGHGGNPFFDWRIGDQISVLRRLEVWSAGSVLDAIKMTWTNDTSVLRGKPAGDSKVINFDPGEMCESLILWGNGIGTRAGRIEIKTRSGKELKVGKSVGRQTPYPMDVGGGILLGMAGRAGSDLDSLASIFVVPLKSISSQVRYIDPPAGRKGVGPQTLDSFQYINDSDQPFAWSWAKSVAREVTKSWSQSVSLSFGQSLSVHAGVPKLVEVGAEAHWEMSTTATHETSESISRTLSWNQSGTVPPYNTISCSAITEEGKANVRYTSDVIFDFKDGRTATLQQDGVYKGIDYTKVILLVKNYQL